MSTTRVRSKSGYVLWRGNWTYVGKRARPSGTMSAANSAIHKRLDKLLDDRIWKQGRDLTEVEMFEWLRCRYPRLHEVMFAHTDNARHRAFEAQYRQAQANWRSEYE